MAISTIDSAGQSVAAIARAADVLMLFAEAEEPTLGVTEIANSLGLSKAVVHRTLTTFRRKGFVELDEQTRRYSLGPKVLELGLVCIDRADVRRIARPEMQQLSARTGETATLSVRTGWTRSYIDQVTPARDVKMVVQLGRPFPLHAGASSKAFLAFLPQEEQSEYVSRPDLERLTPATIVSERALRKELGAIRRRGYAVSMGERQEGAGAVAAPIFGRDGQPAAVMSVSGPVDRFRAEADAAAQLLAATGRVSRRLGHRG